MRVGGGVSRRRGRGTGKDTGTAPEGEATGELERQRGTRGEKRRGGRHPTRETNVYERGSNRRRRDALRVVAYRASASAVRRCERDALSRASAVRVSPIAATGRSGVDRRRTREACRVNDRRAAFSSTDLGAASVDEGARLRRPRTTMRASARTATSSAAPPARLADAAIAASARRRAVGLVDRCRSEGTDVRSPSETHRRSRRRRRRPRRVLPGLRTLTLLAPSLPDLLLQAYRVFHGVSEGVPGVTIDKYGDTLRPELAQPHRAYPPLRAFRESRDATRVSPFPPHRTSLARATPSKP